ncbi:MAG TPA: hypothetical protein VF275_05205 [Gammaproteobacteria bacterium]
MKLDLYVPGLLAAPARLAANLPLPDAPALHEWCARSDAQPVRTGRFGFIETLLDVESAPLAALAWLGATGETAKSPVLFATPVHLQAGMSDLVLFSGPALRVSDDERERLAQDISEFFGDEPAMHFCDGRMFLQAPRNLDVQTTPLHEAQGGAVRDHLPRGADAPRMHGWMNELQMFLHGHALNKERTARGLPSLNGIWPWGEGEIPQAAKRKNLVVFAKTLSMRGLGLLLGETREYDVFERMLPSSGHHIIEVTDCIDALDADDINAWQSAVENVSSNVLQPALDWLAANRDAQAVLYAGDGVALHLRGGKDNWLRRAFRRAPSLKIIEE